MEFRGQVVSAQRDWKTGKLNITFSIDEGNAEDINEINHKDLWITAKFFKKHKTQKSNKYAWALMRDIAAKIGSTPMEVYCNQLMNNPKSPCTYLVVKENAWEKVRAQYRVSVDMGVIPMGNQMGHQLLVYFGLSTYDRKEMQNFINGLVEEAKALNVPVLPDKEIERMIEQWDTQQLEP